MGTPESLQSVSGVNGYDLNSARARGEIEVGDLIEVDRSQDMKAPARSILMYMEPDLNTYAYAADIKNRGIQNGVHYFLLLPNQPKVDGVEEVHGIGIWTNPNNWEKVGHLDTNELFAVRGEERNLQEFIWQM